MWLWPVPGHFLPQRSTESCLRARSRRASTGRLHGVTGEEDQGRLLGIELTDVLAVMGGERFRKKSSLGRWAGCRFHRALNSRPGSTGAQQAVGSDLPGEIQGSLQLPWAPKGWGWRALGQALRPMALPFTLCPQSSSHFILYILVSSR